MVCPRATLYSVQDRLYAAGFDMIVPSTPLRIAVIGAGAIGSTFAFQLTRIGRHDLTVIARPGSVRLKQLQRGGGIVNVNGERAVVAIADTLDEQIRYDLVIVTVLAHQVDNVLPALKRSAALCIQFMFNTFEPARCQDAVGVDRCALGMPFVQSMLDSDGRLTAKIGVAGQKTIINRQMSVDLFNAAGLPARLEMHMLLWLRSHAPLCAAFESVSVASVGQGAGASWGEACKLAKGVHAGFALVKAIDGTIYPISKRRLAGAPTAIVAIILWSVSRSRSFRELLATGKAECVALVDTMIAAAARATSLIDVSAIAAMKPL